MQMRGKVGGAEINFGGNVSNTSKKNISILVDIERLFVDQCNAM